MLAGRYRVTRALKSGAMGSVLEAVDERTGEPCAVKEMHPGRDEEYSRRRFLEEGRHLAALDHPGIPRFRDAFVEGSRHYLVMDLVPGRNLLEEMQERGGPLDPEEVTKAALEALDVLEYLHGRGLVHRDVKPANLVRHERLFLVDFGLAVEASGLARTKIGTPGYCPPEQMEGRAEPRSDLYALGATLYHLLSGGVPRLPYRPLKEVPPGLAEAVATALSLRPADRFADAAAFRAALTRPAKVERPGEATGVFEDALEMARRAHAARTPPDSGRSH